MQEDGQTNDFMYFHFGVLDVATFPQVLFFFFFFFWRGVVLYVCVQVVIRNMIGAH